MSSIKLESNPSGTGVFTLASPNSNTNRTLTLPDNTGTILTGSSAITRSQLPAGSVLQVVSANYSTQVNCNTTTRIDAGISASITPTSSSSKILVLVSVNGVLKDANNLYAKYWLLRGSTDLIKMEDGVGYTNGTGALGAGSVSSAYLDSPATTSSTTYKVQMVNTGTSANVIAQVNNSTSTMTLMEIAA